MGFSHPTIPRSLWALLDSDLSLHGPHSSVSLGKLLLSWTVYSDRGGASFFLKAYCLSSRHKNFSLYCPPPTPTSKEDHFLSLHQKLKEQFNQNTPLFPLSNPQANILLLLFLKERRVSFTIDVRISSFRLFSPMKRLLQAIEGKVRVPAHSVPNTEGTRGIEYGHLNPTPGCE